MPTMQIGGSRVWLSRAQDIGGSVAVRDRQDRDDTCPVINGVQSTVIAAPGGQDFLERRV